MGRLGLLVLAGCGRIAFDPLAGDDSMPPSDGANAACSTNPTCPGLTIPLVVGGNATASSSPSNHGFGAACGGNGSPEAVWKLDPRFDGTYTITVTEGAPAVVALRDGCCTGPVIACEFGVPVTFTRKRGELLFLTVDALGSSVTVSIDGV